MDSFQKLKNHKNIKYFGLYYSECNIRVVRKIWK